MGNKKLNSDKLQQPKHVIVAKVLWVILLVVFLVCEIVGWSVMFDNQVLGAILIPIGGGILVVLLPLFMVAFEPELAEMKLKKQLYTQKKTEQILEEIASNDADIQHRATKKKIHSVVEGVNVEKCPKCGDKVDADEEYCSNCGAHLIRKCPKCKSINGVDDKFCKKCGQKLED